MRRDAWMVFKLVGYDIDKVQELHVLKDIKASSAIKGSDNNA